MQMNKAILRNSKIVIFDKKNNFAAARVNFFSNPMDWKQIFVLRWPYVMHLYNLFLIMAAQLRFQIFRKN